MALNLVKDYGIIGICSSYQNNLKADGLVKDLNINNINKALKMVGLDDNILNKSINDLTLSEKLKVELATKLQENTIVIGNISNSLNFKDQEYIKKLLVKLNSDYHKSIIVIDEDVTVFFNLVKRIYVIKEKQIKYETSDFFDEELYKWVKCPKIIEFINFINENEKRLNNNIDIYELIKDIYRSVS